MTTNPASISPPEEFLNSPEVIETTIKDLMDKASLELTDEDVHRLVAAFRANRAQFAQLDSDKTKGLAPRGQRKPKAPQASAASRLGLADLNLEIDLGDLP
jgi:hypothetical protein